MYSICHLYLQILTEVLNMKAKIILYIAITAVLAACENEIPYNPVNQEPQLIMNAMLDAGQTENYVYLHLSEGNAIGSVKEATLSLYVNDRLTESLQAITPEEKFRLTTALHPGDNIRLEAVAENGHYHVSSEVTVPHPVESLQVDTCLSYLREYNGQKPYRQFKVTLQDSPNEKNYYRLEILNDISYHYEDTVIIERHTEIINREDVILTDGHPTSYDDEENGMFPTIKNKYNIFTDNRFSNSSVTLKVYTRLFDDFYAAEVYYGKVHRKHTVTVRLLSFPEIGYRYLRALNTLGDDDYDESLMEPISLPNNVKGGLGFVGVCSGIEYRMDLPEKTWPKY